MQRQLDEVVHNKLICLMTYLTTNACTHTRVRAGTHTHTVKGGSQLILPHQNYAEMTMITIYIYAYRRSKSDIYAKITRCLVKM